TSRSWAALSSPRPTPKGRRRSAGGLGAPPGGRRKRRPTHSPSARYVTVERDFVAADDRVPAWQRVGAVCGIAAAAVLVASVLIVPQPPKLDAPTGKILAYYVDHRRMLLFSAWLGGLGSALFLWFVGSLRGAWGRASDSAGELSAVAFGGGIALVGCALAGTGVNLTLIYLAKDIQNSADLIRALY